MCNPDTPAYSALGNTALTMHAKRRDNRVYCSRTANSKLLDPVRVAAGLRVGEGEGEGKRWDCGWGL